MRNIILVGLAAFVVYVGLFYESSSERHDVRRVGAAFLEAVQAGDDQRASAYLTDHLRQTCDIAVLLANFRETQLAARDSNGRPLRVSHLYDVELEEGYAHSNTWFETVEGESVGGGALLEYTRENGEWRISSLAPGASVQPGCAPG